MQDLLIKPIRSKSVTNQINRLEFEHKRFASLFVQIPWKSRCTVDALACTSPDWHQWTARRAASHPVVVVPCTKLDAECDRQATVVGRLLTTLGDDRHVVAKLFLAQRLENSCRRNTLMFGDIRISYLFDKYSPTLGGFVP